MKKHASEGAEEIAKALGRTKSAVKAVAHREGISLVEFWVCPRCSRKTFHPLRVRTGWCRRCSLQESKDSAAIANRRARLEAMCEDQEIDYLEHERQALYTDTSKVRKKVMKKQ